MIRDKHKVGRGREENWRPVLLVQSVSGKGGFRQVSYCELLLLLESSHYEKLQTPLDKTKNVDQYDASAFSVHSHNFFPSSPSAESFVCSTGFPTGSYTPPDLNPFSIEVAAQSILYAPWFSVILVSGKQTTLITILSSKPISRVKLVPATRPG